jgi:DNA-directed RNA polymerase subunit alpha
MNNRFLTNNVALIKPAEHYIIDIQDNKAKFRVEPLQRGFGTTLGNALRRTMLSSIAGTAVIGVRIEGVEHEYSVISGVKEDVIDIILNLKSLVVTSDSDNRKTLHLKVTGQTTVTADMIMTSPGVEILNKDLVICNLVDSNSSLDMEIYIAGGSGYSTSEQNKKLLPNLGNYHNVIGIDSIFSPIKRVAFSVETYYSSSHDNELERLLFSIETNSAISPDLAMSVTAKILQDQLKPFIGLDMENIDSEEEITPLVFDKQLLKKIEHLEMSVRSYNCLKNENVVYVGDLVTKEEAELLKTPNFGRKSLSEIKEILAGMGLFLGMKVHGWPPEGNLEELARKYQETTEG